MRDHLSSARQAALKPVDTSASGNNSLKAVFEFDHAGAPHGIPERVMALSHKIGTFSTAARRRLGGLFLLHKHDVSDASSMMILEYDKKSKIVGIEALGQSSVHIQAMQLVISALFHVARDFPGASWAGWMECGMGHDGEKMYHLATSHDKQVRFAMLHKLFASNVAGTSNLGSRIRDIVPTLFELEIQKGNSSPSWPLYCAFVEHERMKACRRTDK